MGEGEETLLRPGGVYLITAGLSRTGLILAHDLARTAQAKLVLLDAAAFPDRAAWPSWQLAHGNRDETSHAIDQLQAIEALGAELLILQADVTHPADMQAALEQARQRFGPLHGVFHLSAARGSGLMQLKTPDQAQHVLAPRVRGTRVLESVLQDRPIDFLVLFGSTVSFTGGLGQVDECAANAFLDAYVQSCDGQYPFRVVAINWSS